MIQEVRGKSLAGLRGVAVVAGVVAAIWLLSRLLTVLQAFIGYTAASILLWLCGILLALWILRRFVMGYRYELNGEELALGRLYGRRVRFMDRLLLRSAVACGSLENMKKRWPDAEVERAVCGNCPMEEMAVVFKADSVKIVVLQPDDAFRSAIIKAVKEH